MRIFSVILAQVDSTDLKQQFSNSRLYEVLVVFGALAGAVIIAVIWAILYSQRQRKKHRHHHHHHSQGAATDNASQGTGTREHKGRRQRRRRRRPHRPMNPTLSQTGGLPPLRDEDTPPYMP